MAIKSLRTGQRRNDGSVSGLLGLEFQGTEPYSGDTYWSHGKGAMSPDALRRRAFQRKLAEFAAQQQQFAGRLTADQKTSSEYAGAQQVGGVAAQTNLEGMRRGLGDEYTAALGADAQTKLRSQVLGSQLSFQERLGQLMYAEQMGFVRGEFDFMNRLQAMNYQNELAKDLARFQANLANDIGMRDILGGIFDLGGIAVGSWAFSGNKNNGGGSQQSTAGDYGIG
jgi:hypothetical protein